MVGIWDATHRCMSCSVIFPLALVAEWQGQVFLLGYPAVAAMDDAF